MSSYDPDKADAFLQGLHTGVGLHIGSPVLLLRSRLLSNAQKKAKLPSREVLAILIKAWIAFIEGRQIKQLHWRNNDENPEPFPTWPTRQGSGKPLPFHLNGSLEMHAS